jgi:hypothetical protein
VIPLEALPLAAGDVVAFVVEGEAPPTLHLAAFVFDRGRTVELPQPEVQAWQDQGLPPVTETSLGVPLSLVIPSPFRQVLEDHERSDEARPTELPQRSAELPYAFDLAPGRYVVELRGEWPAPRWADALAVRPFARYGLLVDVQQAAPSAGPPAAVPGSGCPAAPCPPGRRSRS